MIFTPNEDQWMVPQAPEELHPPPGKGKVIQWWPIGALTLVSLFMMPHTIGGAFLCYFTVAETIYASTGFRLPMPADSDHQASLIVIWLFTLCWNAMLATVWVLTWQGFFREYRLLKWGTATVGRITNKQTSVSSTIAIDFDHSYGAGTIVVKQGLFDSTSIGNAVRICSVPTRPTSSILVDGCFVFWPR